MEEKMQMNARGYMSRTTTWYECPDIEDTHVEIEEYVTFDDDGDPEAVSYDLMVIDPEAPTNPAVDICLPNGAGDVTPKLIDGVLRAYVQAKRMYKPIDY